MLGALSLIFIVCSCSSEKYLLEDEALLTRNAIRFEDPQNVEDPTRLEYQLSSFMEQKPNGNFLALFPRETFYFRNSAPGDSSWYNRWVRKNLAEVPALVDSTASERSAADMQLYLRNLKGYYKAQVRSKVFKKRKKTAKVEYIVNAGQRFRVNSIEYLGYDKDLLQIMNEIKGDAVLKPGDPIDVSLFESEKQRISTHLQNIGYANFKSNRLKIYGDSSNVSKKVDVYMEIIPKPDSSNYVKYEVGDINVYTDFLQDQDINQTHYDTIDDIRFHRVSNDYIVKPEKLGQMIAIKSGLPFSETDRLKTIRKLNSLEVYKFSVIKSVVDSLDENKLDFNIFLTPQNAKWISDVGLETFYSTVTNGRQLIGASVFASLENRNLFGGAERNRLNLEVGGEFQFTDPVGLATSTVRIQDNLEIPRYWDVLRTGKLINRLGIVSDEDYLDFKTDARTNVSFGFSSQKILGLYDIISFNSSIGYFYNRKRSQFSLRQLALNLNSYDLTPEFLLRINNNPFIENSLENNLFTGFLFRDFNYVYTSPKTIKRNWMQFIGNIELSGWEIALANSVANGLSGKNDPWELFSQYSFSKYLRLELDGRFYHEFDDEASFAARLNFAIARPFADSEQVPFIKQFYVGGPSGIRAWQIRELGPGSYDLPELITETSTLFFQQGDLKLQFGLEYRFDILSWLESAFFLDGGNVWTLDDNDTRIGSQFTSSFLQDVALGYGWGLRIDLDYFLIRFDFGYKLRRPYVNAIEGRWIPLRGQKIGNINVAINYPF